MRHRKSGRKLKRTASHRRSLLAALSTELLRHKRITTTIAKAKETRMVIERIITRAKNAAAQKDAPAVGVHARRQVGRLIKDKSVIKELFTSIADRVASRPGGYTRIVKLGQRPGDGAEMAVIELVDFNTGQETEEKTSTAKKQSRPSPRKRAPKEQQESASETKGASTKEKKQKKKGATEGSEEKESR